MFSNRINWRLGFSKCAVAATTFGLAACSVGGPDTTSDTEDEIFVPTQYLWPSARHSDRTRIGVCFENEPTRTTERQWVRDAVRASWGSATKIDFVGFGSCASHSGDVTVIGGIPENIRIRISDENPVVKGGLGTSMERMVLNFTYQKWSPSCSANEAKRRRCIEENAVHEFGHAIGLAHEQNRPDSQCTGKDQGSPGDTFWDYDANSVMNYCAPWSATLSPLDWDGIKLLYGGQRTFANGYYSLWNHESKMFMYMDTPRQSTVMGVATSKNIRNLARLQFIRPNVSPVDGRLAFGDRIHLKAATIINNQPYYIGSTGGTRTPFLWTLGRTDGSKSAGFIDTRTPFTLSGTASNGRTVYLSSNGSGTSAHTGAEEWRLIGGTRGTFACDPGTSRCGDNCCGSESVCRDASVGLCCGMFEEHCGSVCCAPEQACISGSCQAPPAPPPPSSGTCGAVPACTTVNDCPARFSFCRGGCCGVLR